MEAEKIRICCFCEKWESGGIESFLANVIRHFELERFQIDIVASCMTQSIFTKPLQALGVRFFELSGNQRHLVQNHRLFFALLQREQYDIVHLNLFHGLSLAYARTAQRAGVPVRIAHSHNTALRKSILRPLKQAIHHMAKMIFIKDTTGLWACSTAAAEFLFPKTALEQNGFQFIPNGIEIERFQFNAGVRKEVRAELGLEGKFVIGNVGRLCDQKNQSFLLDVFVHVKRLNPESCLLLVGEGELAGYLKRKAQRLNISDSVIFYGVTSHVERLLWAMDVFAFPSRFEGLGIAVIEAQGAGLPVVCADRLPHEAKVVRQVAAIPLNIGKLQWAEWLLSAGTCEHSITANADVKKSFDLQTVAAKVQWLFAETVRHI